MVSSIVLLLCFYFLFIFPFFSSSSIPIRSEYEVSLLFEGWLVTLNKSYEDSLEKEKRYEIFKDNLRYIDEHNAGNHTYTLGLNVFADITVEEYRATYLGLLPPSPTPSLSMVSDETIERNEDDDHYFNVTNTPNAIDWRDLGAVTPVQNQGQCFCCWAFTVLATVEGINKIKTGNLVSLSKQQLVDCHKKSCQRHSLDAPYKYIIKNGGIDTENDYPYQGIIQKCDTTKENNKVVSIDGYQMVTRQNEFALMQAVARQPIAVGVEGYGKDFQLYKKGIFTGFCGKMLDHAVTVIGYDTNGNVDYWIIKNSWGDFWGESGYIRLERNIQDRAGRCGVAMWPFYPIKN